ncbi:hypothetical protein ACQ4PT_002513 [Festuca glaucescens]
MGYLLEVLLKKHAPCGVRLFPPSHHLSLNFPSPPHLPIPIRRPSPEPSAHDFRSRRATAVVSPRHGNRRGFCQWNEYDRSRTDRVGRGFFSIHIPRWLSGEQPIGQRVAGSWHDGEEPGTGAKKEEEEDGDPVGPSYLFADEKEEDHKDWDPTVLPTSEASKHDNEDKGKWKEKDKQKKGKELKEEEDEDDDQILQIDPTVLPTAQPSKQGNEDKGKWKKKDKKKKVKELKAVDVEQQRMGRKACAKREVESVRTMYKGFMDDEDQDKLQQIVNSMSEVQAYNWDDATTADFLKRIEVVKLKVKKQFNDNKTKEKVILDLQTNLDEEAQDRRNKAERMVAEANKVAKLVSDFKTNVSRLKEQQQRVPDEKINQKLERGILLLESLEPMLEQLPVARQNYDELVTTLDKWNEELMSNTFWDRKPSNNRTKRGSKPVLEFDNVNVERVYFNPMRTQFFHFIQSLRDRVCDHPQFGKLESKEGQFETIHKCSLLEYQTTAQKQPPRWIILVMKHDEAEAEIYMRSDNLYICGFSNQKKQIYELGNADNEPLLKGSLPFGCNCDYVSLMNYGEAVEPPLEKDVERLKELVLNKWTVASDIIAFSKYDHTKQKKFGPAKWKKIVERVQMAVGRTAVVFPEVCRFLVLLGLVDQGWENVLGSYLTNLLIEYMRHWKIMSDRLRNDEEGSNTFTKGETDKIVMTYVFEAFKVICLVLNAKGPGIVKESTSKGDGPKPPPPGRVNEGRTSDDDEFDDNNESHPLVEPKNEGGSDSQRSSGGNDKEPSLDDESMAMTIQQELLGVQAFIQQLQGVEASDGVLLQRKVDAINDGLLATASSAMKFQLCGQRLVEILCVHTNSPFVKSISIYDDRRGKVVYKSKDAETVKFIELRDIWLSDHPAMNSDDYMEELVLRGPDCAMSAYPGFVLQADVGDGDGVFDLSWSWEDRTVVDKPMTHSIFTSRGDVHITSAVMSNAVQATVQFLLFLPNFPSAIRRTQIMQVIGRLQLLIENFNVGASMFDSKHDYKLSLAKTAEEAEDGDVGLVCEVPLTRNVFVLPVGSRFRVIGSLALWGKNRVLIDHCMEAKHLLGGLCKWPVKSTMASCNRSSRSFVSHAAVRIKITSPF